jgi:hypothetical protein
MMRKLFIITSSLPRSDEVLPRLTYPRRFYLRIKKESKM